MRDPSLSHLRIANISFLASSEKHDAAVEQKGISNIITYEMLALPRYREQLQYLPAYIRNKDEKDASEYEHSDQCRKYIELPYIEDTDLREKKN